ncbi:MAG: endonuclease Q family protein [Nanoarchaeota archaeon]|nr:endonuclease Q family protein [Nanoarchaeota archaeon]
MIIADLHIHSRFSRATSKELNIPNLEKYARVKGVSLLGTGDFTHAKWLAELKDHLIEDGTGVLKTKTGFPFILSSEVSNIFSRGGKLRKIHNVILAKSFEVVEQVNAFLTKKGNLLADGRPIFGKYGCEELVPDLLSIDPDIEVIPAHVWTPWFGLFGSMSGFDSVKECYGEQTKNIHALETGLSSDPDMNARLSKLDRYNLVSFSDCHSFWPWRIGREATIFDCTMSYDNLLKALRTGKGYHGTIEVDPNYGKYHFDGHRNCKTCMSPEESLKHKKICPVCRKPMTIGVLSRVEELADRPEGTKAKIPFKKLIPLHEIIGAVQGMGVATQKTWKQFHELVGPIGSEFGVMLDATREELLRYADETLVDAIINVREQKITVKPGYDGEYGVPVFGKTPKKTAKPVKKSQLSLSDF